MTIPILTDIESDWLSQFSAVIKKRPSALQLIVDSAGDGDVEVFSQSGRSFTASERKWIAKIEAVLAVFPKTPEFWVLSNIDGLNVGKGRPSMISSSSYGPGGATGSIRDDFAQFYVFTTDVEYGDISEEKREACEIAYLKTCIGDLRIRELKE